MNESQKHSKVEMEILSHEKEMLREAMIRKLHDAPLKDRLLFIIKDSSKSEWTSPELLEELNTMGLGENVTEEHVKEFLQGNGM
jgi:hypothetical protein